jgi:hypothetical protein
MLTKAERYRIMLVSELAAEDVKRMRLEPARSLAEALNHVDAKAEGYILPRGAAVLPTLRN